MSYPNYGLLKSIAVHNNMLALRVWFKSHRAIHRLYVMGDHNNH